MVQKNTSRKAGIVTFYNEANYGAVLQTYALQEVLRQFGFQPSIIGYSPDYENRNWQRKRLFQSHSPASFARLLVGKTLYYKHIHRYRAEFLYFFEKYYSRTDRVYHSYEELCQSPPDCSAFIVGSDQVWNPLSIHPKFFLDFAADTQKRISYAASFGVHQLPEAHIVAYKNALEKFAYISVRESSGQEIVQRLGRTAECVLDPTLLRNMEDWNQLVNAEPDPGDLPVGRYLLVYAHTLNNALMSILVSLKKTMEMPIVYVGPFGRFCFDKNLDKLYIVGPISFLKLFRNATRVLTNSFHGTCFCYLFQKPFVTVTSSKAEAPRSGALRVYHLLNLLGLQNRLVEGTDDLPRDFDTVDFDKADQLLLSERQKSLSFLKNALEN